MPLKGSIPEKHKDKFCLFHNANGHTTASCFDLKNEIEYLIRRGKLAGYRKDADRGAKISLNRRIRARSIDRERINLQKVECKPGGSGAMLNDLLLNDKLCKREDLSEFLDEVCRNHAGGSPSLVIYFSLELCNL